MATVTVGGLGLFNVTPTRSYGRYSNASFGSNSGVTSLTFSTTDYSSSSPPAFTYSRNSSDGDTWTVNSSGLYIISANLLVNSSPGPGNISYSFISKNSSSTISYVNISSSSILGITSTPSLFGNLVYTGYLASGDVIRIHGNGLTGSPTSIGSSSQNILSF